MSALDQLQAVIARQRDATQTDKLLTPDELSSLIRAANALRDTESNLRQALATLRVYAAEEFYAELPPSRAAEDCGARARFALSAIEGV